MSRIVKPASRQVKPCPADPSILCSIAAARAVGPTWEISMHAQGRGAVEALVMAERAPYETIAVPSAR